MADATKIDRRHELKPDARRAKVRLRVTDEEHAHYFAAARAAGVKFSEWARRALNTAAARE